LFFLAENKKMFFIFFSPPRHPNIEAISHPVIPPPPPPSPANDGANSDDEGYNSG
jgi:hypothetical protein